MLDKDVYDVLWLIAIMTRLYHILIALNRRRRRVWVSAENMNRNVFGLYECSFEHLTQNPQQFRSVTRMSVATFRKLQNILKPSLTKGSVRTPINAECRLFITLIYLAHGGNQQLHTIAHKMGQSTFRRIVLDTCGALWRHLASDYIAAPSTSEWQRIAESFADIWDMPNCVGAIDAKHLPIKYPAISKRKPVGVHRFNVLITGISDANYCFTSVHIGSYVDVDEGGTKQYAQLVGNMNTGSLELPDECCLPVTDEMFPHYFVGAAAYPLSPYLMKVYAEQELSAEQEHFNGRLSRAHNIIENTFGVLMAKWKILSTKLCLSPDNAEHYVKGCVVLHNFLKLTESNYFDADFVDHYVNDELVAGTWRKHTKPLPSVAEVNSNAVSANGHRLRENLCNYFQYDHI